MTFAIASTFSTVGEYKPRSKVLTYVRLDMPEKSSCVIFSVSKAKNVK